ncbi:MAG TPA: hypothetical protein VMX38_05045 [Verrucomicrobiae bacterium]|nr:hypothetical protein [Verrucomicrobiae bacterium]
MSKQNAELGLIRDPKLKKANSAPEFLVGPPEMEKMAAEWNLVLGNAKSNLPRTSFAPRSHYRDPASTGGAAVRKSWSDSAREPGGRITLFASPTKEALWPAISAPSFFDAEPNTQPVPAVCGKPSGRANRSEAAVFFCPEGAHNVEFPIADIEESAVGAQCGIGRWAF